MFPRSRLVTNFRWTPQLEALAYRAHHPHPGRGPQERANAGLPCQTRR